MLCYGILVVMWCNLPPQAASYCSIANPVKVSHADTRETKNQADREYRKWKSVCAGAK